MATTPAFNRSVKDRRLYIGSAVLKPLIVLIGFAPTYYLSSWEAVRKIGAERLSIQTFRARLT